MKELDSGFVVLLLFLGSLFYMLYKYATQETHKRKNDPYAPRDKDQ